VNEIHLRNIDLNLLVVFEVLMQEHGVARAADRLGRTPSAVSHALARLRQTFGDPLLVKVNGKMQASPFALQLIEEVRPILRGIQRLVERPGAFDPATSDRLFRLAGPALDTVIAEIAARVHALAPRIRIEWLPHTQTTYAEVIDETIDVAYGNSHMPLPEGVRDTVLPGLKRYVLMREDHPALQDWSQRTWLRWPHLVVALSNVVRETVDDRLTSLGLQRTIGLRVPNWSAIGPVLQRTNLLSNQNALVFQMQRNPGDFAVLETPVPLPLFVPRVFWNARLEADPARAWIRRIMIETMTHLIGTATVQIEAHAARRHP
jgi:LysR family transcriptional activator of mexEF-oprN operon